MKLFGLNITRSPRSDPPTLQRSFSALEAAWLRGDDLGGQTGTVLSNAYEQSVWVYRAINVLAEQVANIPFLFSHGERGRENLITGGPLHEFYAHPNPYVNRFQYWELRVIWLMLRGECFRIPIFESSSSSSSVRAPSPGGEGGILGRTSGEGEFSRSHPSIHQSTNPSLRRRLSRVLILDPAHFQHIIEDGQ